MKKEYHWPLFWLACLAFCVHAETSCERVVACEQHPMDTILCLQQLESEMFLYADSIYLSEIRLIPKKNIFQFKHKQVAWYEYRKNHIDSLKKLLSSESIDSVKYWRIRIDFVLKHIDDLKYEKYRLRWGVVKSQIAQLAAKAKLPTETNKGRKTNAQKIEDYEKMLEHCSQKDSIVCSHISLSLAELLYEQARDNYVQERNKYEKIIAKWEDNPDGPEPINPVPDYTKALMAYKNHIRCYPGYEDGDKAYYELHTIYMLMGMIDSSEAALQKLRELYPNSIRATALRSWRRRSSATKLH
jgi:tetratricopeptide (TPR) repeat protein